MIAPQSSEPPVSKQVESAALEELLLSRAYVYTLLHKIFAATPDAKTLDVLLSDATAEAVAVYINDDETMRGLADFLSVLAAREDRKQLLGEVRDEYVRLFVGPGSLPAPSWESPYLTKDQSIFQENTLTVRSLYKEHGFEPKKLQRVPDDHVALLCAFMAARAKDVLETMRHGDLDVCVKELRSQCTFINEHMVSWLGTFARALRAVKTAVLYPQVVEAAAAFVALDSVFLSEAAFWVDEYVSSGSVARDSGVLSGTSEAQGIECREQTQAALEAVRPFGVEDYELITIGRTRPSDKA